MSTLTLPPQPENVREWIRQARSLERQATATLLSVRPGDDTVAKAGQVLEILNAAFVMPEDIRSAYERWATEYNAVVDRINAERQARRNAREAASLRASACPRCYATHAGEC